MKLMLFRTNNNKFNRSLLEASDDSCSVKINRRIVFSDVLKGKQEFGIILI